MRRLGQVAKLHDISVPINAGMHVYDGNPGFLLELVDSIAAGATANVSRLDLGVHKGTHVDAPVHFIDGGAGTESLDLETLVGPASVVDATAVSGQLDAESLKTPDAPVIHAHRQGDREDALRILDHLPNIAFEFQRIRCQIKVFSSTV